MSRSITIPVGMFVLATLGGLSLYSSTSVAQSSDAAQSASASPDKPAEDKAKEKAERRARQARLTRELAIARVKLEQARLAADHQALDSKEAILKAEQERELSGSKLEDLQKNQGPSRLDKAKHGLKGAEDSLRENEEELAQLEMMYAESELGDKTKEIVIQRAKRRLEQVRWWLSIQQNDLTLLSEHSLPLETREAQQQLDDKTRALDAARRAADAAAIAKKIELLSAESEIARIEQELSDVAAEIAREN